MRLLIFLISVISYSQTYVNLGVDPKIGLFGTDNKYTVHTPVSNFILKVEHIDDIEVGIGIEYVNLQQWYFAYYTTFGYSFGNDLKVIPNFEVGSIIRQHIKTDGNDNRSNPNSLYAGVNLPIRYMISDAIGFELQSKLLLRTDLPNRLLGYSGYINLIYKI